MNLGAQNTALKEQVSKLCELLVNMHLKSLPNILTALYRDNCPLRFSGYGCHPAIRTSGAERFFNSMLVFD